MNETRDEYNVVSDIYDNYEEVQKEILSIEIRKTRNKLITIAIVLFSFDLLVLLMSDLVSVSTLGLIIIIPSIIGGLAVLSVKEPLIAMIIASMIIVGTWIYTIILTGGRAAASGWIGKAIIVYLIFAGFQNATEAARIKKELKL